jgi:membrane dipeptidase
LGGKGARDLSRRARWIAAGTAVALAATWLYLGLRLEDHVNVVRPVPLPAISERARALHATIPVADLHADSLLFGRDISRRSRIGHVDLPRLQEGGVALQMFTAATVMPVGLDIHHTDADAPDLIRLVGLLQLSPFLWRGPLGRALLQAERLERAIARSEGALLPIRTRADLAELRALRAAGRPVVGAVLGIEGAHALESDPANLDVVFAAGFRMIGLTHFFDNDYAGSAHGLEKGPLTPLGRETLRRMESLGILVDVAHLAPRAIDDSLAFLTKPVVFSHGGVRGTCDNPRNLSDDHIRAIAAGGGVVGIGYWEMAVCGTELRHVVAAIRYVIDLVGDDHVGLGSDYDGGTTVGFDTSALPALTQALLDAGLSEASVRKVMGENVWRVLEQTLPRDSRPALRSSRALRANLAG